MYRQNETVDRRGLGDGVRGRGKFDVRGAVDLVEPPIAEPDGGIGGSRSLEAASSFPCRAADLEDIVIIGAEGEAKGQLDLAQAVVDDTKMFVTDLFCEYLRAKDMDRPHLDLHAVISVQIRGGKIHREQQIVFGDRGVEQQGTFAVDGEFEGTQIPRPGMIESLLTQADLLNVAVGIEKTEGFFRL